MLRFPYLAVLLGLAAVSCACSAKTEATPEGSSSFAVRRKAAARFYYDLGPATVDVSGYPPVERENYKIFLSVCGTCHSAARPLNAPYAGADIWKGFVRRMHTKMESQAVLPSPKEEARILEFLVYDSGIRKIARSSSFQAQQEELKKLFEKAP